jgi:hypothetical protein
MTLPVPDLDDRSFDELMKEALEVLRRNGAGWTDLTVSDPGVTLVEAFAHLTEQMIYRINQVPDKVYVALLNLLGVDLMPPFAASAPLRFELAQALPTDLHLPAGLRVVAAGNEGGEPVAFETVLPGVIKAGETVLTLQGGHFVWHEAEPIGRGSGLPGLRLKVAHGPIIAPGLPGENLIVGVETATKDIPAGAPTLEHEGKAFVLWQEVERFGPATAGQRVFTVNRAAGEIAFAPALRLPGADGLLPPHAEPVGQVPPAAREIRAWYRGAATGTGAMRAGLLTAITPPIQGLSVSNPLPATGARPTESLENALARGPMMLSGLGRAITARDFEVVARQANGAVNRALAIADVSLWAHGVPGTVNLTLVPEVAEPATPQTLQAAQKDNVLAEVAAVIDARRAVGASVSVNWARYQTVSVKADVRIHPSEDPEVVRGRLTERLNRFITPVDRGPQQPGWPFGRPLLDWDVLRAIADQPGVVSITGIRLAVDRAPSAEVGAVACDAYQANTWFAVSGPDVFRSGNNGDSWEVMASFPGAAVTVDAFRLESGAARPGMLAVVSREGEVSRLHLSRDCGNSFELISQFQFEVSGVAWIVRGTATSLLLASPRGLFEVELRRDAAPQQILFDPAQPELAATSIAVSSDAQGRVIVAVGGGGQNGVYISMDAGRAGTFSQAGLKGQLVRVLMLQHTPTQRWLWAGTSAVGRDAGNGAFRLRLEATGADPDGWQPFAAEWTAGSCRTLAHDGKTIYAGSLRLGVLTLDPDAATPAWRTPDVGCGLPMRDVGRLQPINTLAAVAGRVLAGGPGGIHRSTDGGARYRLCSAAEQQTELKLPANWLFCSGRHELTMRRRDDA